MATQFYLQLATARLPATALLLPRRPLTWQRAAIATSVGAGALLLAWAYAKWLMRCNTTTKMREQSEPDGTTHERCPTASQAPASMPTELLVWTPGPNHVALPRHNNTSTAAVLASTLPVARRKPSSAADGAAAATASMPPSTSTPASPCPDAVSCATSPSTCPAAASPAAEAAEACPQAVQRLGHDHHAASQSPQRRPQELPPAVQLYETSRRARAQPSDQGQHQAVQGDDAMSREQPQQQLQGHEDTAAARRCRVLTNALFAHPSAECAHGPHDGGAAEPQHQGPPAASPPGPRELLRAMGFEVRLNEVYSLDAPEHQQQQQYTTGPQLASDPAACSPDANPAWPAKAAPGLRRLATHAAAPTTPASPDAPGTPCAPCGSCDRAPATPTTPISPLLPSPLAGSPACSPQHQHQQHHSAVRGVALSGEERQGPGEAASSSEPSAASCAFSTLPGGSRSWSYPHGTPFALPTSWPASASPPASPASHAPAAVCSAAPSAPTASDASKVPTGVAFAAGLNAAAATTAGDAAGYHTHGHGTSSRSSASTVACDFTPETTALDGSHSMSVPVGTSTDPAAGDPAAGADSRRPSCRSLDSIPSGALEEEREGPHTQHDPQAVVMYGNALYGGGEVLCERDCPVGAAVLPAARGPCATWRSEGGATAVTHPPSCTSAAAAAAAAAALEAGPRRGSHTGGSPPSHSPSPSPLTSGSPFAGKDGGLAAAVAAAAAAAPSGAAPCDCAPATPPQYTYSQGSPPYWRLAEPEVLAADAAQPLVPPVADTSDGTLCTLASPRLSLGVAGAAEPGTLVQEEHEEPSTAAAATAAAAAASLTAASLRAAGAASEDEELLLPAAVCRSDGGEQTGLAGRAAPAGPWDVDLLGDEVEGTPAPAPASPAPHRARSRTTTTSTASAAPRRCIPAAPADRALCGGGRAAARGASALPLPPPATHATALCSTPGACAPTLATAAAAHTPEHRRQRQRRAEDSLLLLQIAPPPQLDTSAPDMTAWAEAIRARILQRIEAACRPLSAHAHPLQPASHRPHAGLALPTPAGHSVITGQPVIISSCCDMAAAHVCPVATAPATAATPGSSPSVSPRPQLPRRSHCRCCGPCSRSPFPGYVAPADASRPSGAARPAAAARLHPPAKAKARPQVGPFPRQCLCPRHSGAGQGGEGQGQEHERSLPGFMRPTAAHVARRKAVEAAAAAAAAVAVVGTAGSGAGPGARVAAGRADAKSHRLRGAAVNGRRVAGAAGKVGGVRVTH